MKTWVDLEYITKGPSRVLAIEHLDMVELNQINQLYKVGFAQK